MKQMEIIMCNWIYSFLDMDSMVLSWTVFMESLSVGHYSQDEDSRVCDWCIPSLINELVQRNLFILNTHSNLSRLNLSFNTLFHFSFSFPHRFNSCSVKPETLQSAYRSLHHLAFVNILTTVSFICLITKWKLCSFLLRTAKIDSFFPCCEQIKMCALFCD